jgi:adenine-specific DNA-methyltransferase
LATTSKDTRPNLRYPVTIEGREIWPEKQWIWQRERIEEALANDEVVLNDNDGKPSVRVKQYLKDEHGRMREMKPLSLMIGPYNQEGSKETEALLGDGVFSFPKPVALIRQLLALTINDERDSEDIVLDFFAGSGTLGQAAMEQSQADGRKRRFILVQLPESLAPEAKEQKVAAEFCARLGKLQTLAEVTKERLRRAAEKIRTENPMFVGDLGFRVFRLDSSNIQTWDPDRADLGQSLLDSLDHLKEGRTEQDILYELLLKLGLDLCVPMETRTIAGKDVHAIGGGVLMACLAESISREDVESLAHGIVEWHEALSPAGEVTCVFRDSAFADDVAKTNLAAILAQRGIDNVRSL